ncbi:helix-turn-helix domain-containing protein [Lentilactobacillus sp. SPB1-3]|uniref:Helix-turn-helix domain-containing protein n=1 Tax=Lentilactobacillus terminaliae TaxID=3003483 RepID=A0ACD5DCY9_9LACO
MNNIQLWKKISELLNEQNISVYALAKSIGVPTVSLFNIKNGSSKNPSVFLIAKIAKKLHVSLDDLIY